jgi:hypothetical protein
MTRDELSALCWKIANEYWEPEESIATILGSFDRSEKVITAARALLERGELEDNGRVSFSQDDVSDLDCWVLHVDKGWDIQSDAGEGGR